MTKAQLQQKTFKVTDPFHPAVIEIDPASLDWYYVLPLRLKGKKYSSDTFLHYADPGAFTRKRNYKTTRG